MKLLPMVLPLLLLIGCSDPIKEIETKNQYTWQKYMNEKEYNKVHKGMTYLEVVKIAGGSGKKISKMVYEWPDEILLTKAYQITFKNEKVVEKIIVEKRGSSSR